MPFRVDSINVNDDIIVSDTITAGTIVKSGGTASQFLKANGSVDSTSYTPTNGSGASGTWGISITGNADTVDGSHASEFVPKTDNWVYGYHPYAWPNAEQWWKIAEVTLNGACQSYNFWGTYRHTGSWENNHVFISMTARAECSFPNNNEDHHVMVNMSGSGTNSSTYTNRLRVVLVASSTNLRRYELQYYNETWDAGNWQFQTNQGWTLYTSRQNPGTPTGTSKAYLSGELVSNGLQINGTAYVSGRLTAGGGLTSQAQLICAAHSGTAPDYPNPLWVWAAQDSDAMVIQCTTAGGTPPKIYFRDSNGIIQTSNTLIRLRTGNNDSLSAYLNGSTWNCTGDIVAYASDKRLKDNVKVIDNAIEKVKSLNGVTFDWNEKCDEVGFVPKRKKDEIGVIAQEVQAVIPQAIESAPFDTDDNGQSKSGDNYLTVKYEKIVPLLIEAIKEQQKQIEELKNIVNAIAK